jgi:SWI/SNF related-matrix-associated actin-dependent regulator of chromatin subfamily C
MASPEEGPERKRLKLNLGSATPLPSGSGVTEHELGSAPGKEREREPIYGGDVANLGPGEDG